MRITFVAILGGALAVEKIDNEPKYVDMLFDTFWTLDSSNYTPDWEFSGLFTTYVVAGGDVPRMRVLNWIQLPAGTAPMVG